MITAALRTAGINPDTITKSPDSIVTVTGHDGVRAVIGDDGRDEGGQQWWTATLYARDGEIGLTESSADLSAVASAVATWVSAT